MSYWRNRGRLSLQTANVRQVMVQTKSLVIYTLLFRRKGYLRAENLFSFAVRQRHGFSRLSASRFLGDGHNVSKIRGVVRLFPGLALQVVCFCILTTQLFLHLQP